MNDDSRHLYRPNRIIIPSELCSKNMPSSGSLEELADALVNHVLDMSPGVLRYRELTAEWMAARELAGGELTADEESEWVEKIDAVWRTLGPGQQDFLDPRSEDSRSE